MSTYASCAQGVICTTQQGMPQKQEDNQDFGCCPANGNFVVTADQLIRQQRYRLGCV